MSTELRCEEILEYAQSVKLVDSRLGEDDKRLFHVMIYTPEVIPAPRETVTPILPPRLPIPFTWSRRSNPRSILTPLGVRP
jgi:hypothetical protein